MLGSIRDQNHELHADMKFRRGCGPDDQCVRKALVGPLADSLDPPYKTLNHTAEGGVATFHPELTR